jgi:soluble lytic murein transglycosylase-like protein
VAALTAGALGPPRLIFFDFPSAPIISRKAYSSPESPSRYGRQQAAYRRAVGFIREEKFAEALTFLRKQSSELRAWPGLAGLEAGLLSVAQPKEALAIYDRILVGKVRDRYWVRALAGYRVLLKNLSAEGDYLARARLVRLLAAEWRNQEAKKLLAETLADVALPTAARQDLEAFGAVLDTRVGNFATAEAYWRDRPDIVSRRYLATLRLRQGRLDEAANIRLETAKLLKGSARLKELGRAFDALTKGGLTDRAKELLDQEPELKKRLNSWSFHLGLSALVAKNPEEALAYFEAEEKRPGRQGARALYYKGRSLELLQRFSDASQIYQVARFQAPSFYQILSAGRYEFLNDQGRPKSMAQDMVGLMESPAGAEDQKTMGYYLWLADKLPWPWLDLKENPTSKMGLGEMARTKMAINHYLAQGDWREAALELAGGYEELLPKKPQELDNELKRWILLAAQSGDYRLALRFLGQVRTPNGSLSRAWAHPVVYSQPILKACRLYGFAPQLLLSVIRVESAFQKDAVSTSNARGLTQLLPSTAHSISVILGEPEPREEDLFDPDLNIRYGSWYLNQLFQAFGQWPLALAAYNGGPFNIKSYMAARPGLPLDVFIETLPLPETIRYVQSVLESQFVYDAAYFGVNNYPNLTNPVGAMIQEPPPF